MNEKYLIAEEGVKTYVKDGKPAGYEFGARVPYYFSIPFSQIKHIRVSMDGIEEDQANIRIFAESGEEFKLSEIITVSEYHWEYGKKLRICVLRDGGLAGGSHRLELDTAIAVIYGGPRGFASSAYMDFNV